MPWHMGGGLVSHCSRQVGACMIMSIGQTASKPTSSASGIDVAYCALDQNLHRSFWEDGRVDPVVWKLQAVLRAGALQHGHILYQLLQANLDAALGFESLKQQPFQRAYPELYTYLQTVYQLHGKGMIALLGGARGKNVSGTAAEYFTYTNLVPVGIGMFQTQKRGEPRQSGVVPEDVLSANVQAFAVSRSFVIRGKNVQLMPVILSETTPPPTSSLEPKTARSTMPWRACHSRTRSITCEHPAGTSHKLPCRKPSCPAWTQRCRSRLPSTLAPAKAKALST